jgi:transposase
LSRNSEGETFGAWKLCSGASWRDVPERYGPWQTVYARFCTYRDDSTLDRILRALRLKLDAESQVGYSTWMVDGTSIRASRVASGARKKGARTRRQRTKRSDEDGGVTPKLHVVCDGNGLPLAVHLTAGQRVESAQFETLCDLVEAPRRPRQLLADRGYDAQRIRAWLRARRIRAVIPERKPAAGKERRRRGRPPVLDKSLNAVERLIGWLKEHRSLATRFDNLASSSLAMVKLACMLLRAAFPNTA